MNEEEFLKMAETYGIRVGNVKTYPGYPERDYKELFLADIYVGKISWHIHFGSHEKDGLYFCAEPDPYKSRTVNDELKISDATEEKFVAVLQRQDLFSSKKLLSMMDKFATYLDDVMNMKRKLGA